MSPLPTFNAENIFSSDEIDLVDQLVNSVGIHDVDDSGSYPDSGKHGRYSGKTTANNIHWNYHRCPEIEKILTPKLEQLLQRQLLVTDAHILEAKLPYLVHTDFIHNNQGHVPEYTVIIPLDTYDSVTVCFNEWAEDYNDFEIFKQSYQGEKKLRIDPGFAVDRLNHIHPKDIVYLTVHDTFAWRKGSVFAMDRRYFHCSDNFVKRGLPTKRAIILWTLSSSTKY
jgi:hypothetical protein